MSKEDLAGAPAAVSEKSVAKCVVIRVEIEAERELAGWCIIADSDIRGGELPDVPMRD